VHQGGYRGGYEHNHQRQVDHDDRDKADVHDVRGCGAGEVGQEGGHTRVFMRALETSV